MNFIEKVKEHLKIILTKERYKHSLLVTETAVELAEIYGVDKEKAALAGLLHDCAKYFHLSRIKELLKNDREIEDSDYLQPEILHGFAGAIYARNVFRIEDKEVLSAIKYHTTGRHGMTILEKIIYISDWIEPSRKGEDVEEIRKAAYKNIDKAILALADEQILYLVKKDKMIHRNTIEMRNDILRKSLNYK